MFNENPYKWRYISLTIGYFPALLFHVILMFEGRAAGAIWRWLPEFGWALIILSSLTQSEDVWHKAWRKWGGKAFGIFKFGNGMLAWLKHILR